MKTIQVYDKPMCCSTGVCGPDVDPVLPRFAADLQWLQSQGYEIERFNLAQQPQAFIQNPEVHQLLATEGTNCLPLILINGRIASRRVYPMRDQLIAWTADLPVVAAGCGSGLLQVVAQACCTSNEQAQAATGDRGDCLPTGCC